jgi:hypothetical protein
MFNDIIERRHMISWLTVTFPYIFDEIVLGKKERESLYSSNVDTPKFNTVIYKKKIWKTATFEEKMKEYMVKEYSFNNLARGFSLNFFNIVINDQVRLNIRKSVTSNNPSSKFSKIAPKVKVFL